MKQRVSFYKLTGFGIIKPVKISVLTPSFNSVEYIQRAIESVLAQGYNDFEHIIMDGGSTDGTVEIIKQYPHLIWESAPDRGQSDAMNKAFHRSTGEIIMYLNADDEVDPGVFEKVIAVFNSNPGMDMVVGKLRLSRPDGIAYQEPSLSLEVILELKKYKFPFNPVAYYYKRKLQERIGDFPIDNHYTMDYWFLLRAYLLGGLVKSEDVFGTFYFDGMNKSSDEERSRLELIRVRDKFLVRNFYRYPCLKHVLKRAIH